MIRMKMFRISFIVVSLNLLSGVHAETKLTPLKTGGGRPLESLRAKKEPKTPETPAPVKKTVEPPEQVFKGPKNGWGVVGQRSSFYSNEGDNLGTLPAGTMLTYSGVRHATKCFVLVAKVQRQEGKWEGPVLMEVPDVVLFSGELAEMPEKLINDIRAYYTMKGKLEARKEEIEDSALMKNPYYESARLWQKRYADSADKAREMEEKANELKGPAKSKMLDELRSLKYEQVRLKTQADKEAANYKAFKDQNPISPALFNNDAALKTLQAQLKEAKEKIKDVVVNE